MNTDSTPSHDQLPQAELLRLIRDGNPPLTRRELRQRDAAEAAGLLVRDGQTLSLAPMGAATTSGAATPTEPRVDPEPPVVTSADVLAGNVSATSGLTRRQLRELAEQGAAESATASGPVPSPTSTTPAFAPPAEAAVPGRTAPAEAPAPDLNATPAAAETPVPQPAEPPAPQPAEESSIRRPVVRPAGAVTGEYSGQFEALRDALANTDAVPAVTQSSTEVPAAAAPERRSIFDHDLTPIFDEPDHDELAKFTDTNAADLSAVMDTPMVTDNLLPEVPEPSATPDEAPLAAFNMPEFEDPEQTLASLEAQPDLHVAPVRDSAFGGLVEPPPAKGFPDWHTLTELPRVDQSPQQGSEVASAPLSRSESDRTPRSRKSPIWLTVLQWFVIAVVAVVLGLLVWYAINKGFGPAQSAAAGIIPPIFYLRL